MINRTPKRATSVTNFINMEFELIEFTGEWNLAFGKPQKGGIWYLGGRPTMGKTSFIVQLIKELALLGERVRFYNWEEQASLTMQETLQREQIIDVAANVVIWNELFSYREFVEDIQKTRNDAIVVDSIQKSGFTARQVEELRNLFPNKTIIFSSHVQPSGLPDKQAANQVYREASLKILIDRFRAISQGRFFGERGYYTIWEMKANELWAVIE